MRHEFRVLFMEKCQDPTNQHFLYDWEILQQRRLAIKK
jgi:hypothetical protein